jgi:hypothetical protein
MALPMPIGVALRPACCDLLENRLISTVIVALRVSCIYRFRSKVDPLSVPMSNGNPPARPPPCDKKD